MARRWQLSVWVLAGLVLTVVALWDNATVSAVADRMTERTETVDASDRPDTDDPAPSDLAFGELDGSGPGDGGSNLLRPTTTTTTRPTTTTTSTTLPPDPSANDEPGDGTDSDGEQAPGSATTVPVGDQGDMPGTNNPGGSTSTAPNRSSSTVTDDRGVNTVFAVDFADGSLTDGRWSMANSVGTDGWGLLRPSSVAVVSDRSASGGHVLAITARMGSGAESGQVVSGAVRLLGHGLTHGRYSVRARVEPDPARATSGVILLAPVASTDAPESEGGEIRIMDTGRNRSTRTPVESTLRWDESGGTASIEKAHSVDGPVSASSWHVYTLDWTADRVVVSVDGEPLTLTADPAQVPPGPMGLAIRLDALDTPSAPGEQPTLSGEIRLLIDWIRIEEFTGESAQ